MRKVLFTLSVAFTMLVGGIQAFASVSDDQVTSQKIKEADGTSGQNTNSGAGVKTNHIQNSAVTSAKIAYSAVTTTNIADGAVTDAKITGPISGSKLGAHAHIGSDITDGSITTSKIADGSITNAKIGEAISVSKIGTYANAKIVHKGSADGVNTFNTIQSAINWIVANDPPSSS